MSRSSWSWLNEVVDGLERQDGAEGRRAGPSASVQHACMSVTVRGEEEGLVRKRECTLDAALPSEVDEKVEIVRPPPVLPTPQTWLPMRLDCSSRPRVVAAA